MDVEQVKSVNVWPYVGFYSLMMTGLTVVFMGILIIFPSLPDSVSHASGFAIAFGSTSFASYSLFQKDVSDFSGL